MKKSFFYVTLFASVVAFTACSEKSGEAESSESVVTEASSVPVAEEAEVSPANEPKTYKVNLTPDSAFLGKKKEAFVKIVKAEAVDLQDQDGNSQGVEINFVLSVTNKNEIGGDQFGISASDFRLQLDNGTNVTSTSGGYVSAAAESTSISEPITFLIPAGAKPKALNLFYDNTRASVGVTLK